MDAVVVIDRALALRADTLVGAGTVLTATQADQAVEAGATFVVSPGLSRPVVERCLELGVPVVPRTSRCPRSSRWEGRGWCRAR